MLGQGVKAHAAAICAVNKWKTYMFLGLLLDLKDNSIQT